MNQMKFENPVEGLLGLAGGLTFGALVLSGLVIANEQTKKEGMAIAGLTFASVACIGGAAYVNRRKELEESTPASSNHSLGNYELTKEIQFQEDRERDYCRIFDEPAYQPEGVKQTYQTSVQPPVVTTIAPPPVPVPVQTEKHSYIPESVRQFI
jgi:hypothetical protein